MRQHIVPADYCLKGSHQQHELHQTVSDMFVYLLLADQDKCEADRNYCEQLCHDSEFENRTCSCNDGYTLGTDLRSCQSKYADLVTTSNTFFVFSGRNDK